MAGFRYQMIKLTWHIGDVVRKVRETRGLDTQKKLAKKCDPPMRANTLSDFERYGDTYNFENETLQRILKALDLEKHELYALVPVQREAVTSPVTPPLNDRERALLAIYRRLHTDDQTIVDLVAKSHDPRAAREKDTAEDGRQKPGRTGGGVER